MLIRTQLVDGNELGANSAPWTKLLMNFCQIVRPRGASIITSLNIYLCLSGSPKNTRTIALILMKQKNWQFRKCVLVSLSLERSPNVFHIAKASETVNKSAKLSKGWTDFGSNHFLPNQTHLGRCQSSWSFNSAYLHLDFNFILIYMSTYKYKRHSRAICYC